MSGLREHFIRKATAAGAVVSDAPDDATVRRLHPPGAGDHVADGLFAVAETGSIAVAWSREERGRALLSDRLFVVVPGDQLVGSLDEALARIDGLVREGRPYVTLMTGPSRTADIERALTVGVHGPRELHVMLTS